MAKAPPKSFRAQDAAQPEGDFPPAPETETSVAALSVAEQLALDDKRVIAQVDGAGRRIEVRKLQPTDMLKVMLLMGEESANQQAVQMVLNVCSVVAIDGESVPRPATMLQVEALMNRLDFHGLQAVGIALSKFTTPMLNMETALKNS